jgi:hypothetical protein
MVKMKMANSKNEDASEFIELRNKYLKPDGYVFPSQVGVFLAGARLSDYAFRINY